MSELSKVFMDLVYERIRHGDEAHQHWLKEECIKLEGSLHTMLEACGQDLELSAEGAKKLVEILQRPPRRVPKLTELLNR